MRDKTQVSSVLSIPRRRNARDAPAFTAPILASGMGGTRVFVKTRVRSPLLHLRRLTLVSLQITATHCNTLQHTGTHGNTRHTATHGNTRQHTATHCNTRQHTTTHCNTQQHTATHGNTLQHTATPCNMLLHFRRLTLVSLQHNTSHCNTLQHTATHCNILQHTAPPLASHSAFVSSQCGCVCT